MTTESCILLLSFQLLGRTESIWSASIASYKRATAYQSDVHQGCAPVGQHEAVIPGSAPTVLALPPLSPPSFPLQLPSLHAVVFLLFSPGRGCLDHAAWPGCQGRDPGRGSGATGEAWAQSTSLYPASPSTSPGCQLHQSPSSLCAQQANQAISVWHATWGPGGQSRGGGWSWSRQVEAPCEPPVPLKPSQDLCRHHHHV